MNIGDIIDILKPCEVAGSRDYSAEVEHLTYDSREVERGGCLFAIRGTQSDGHQYVASAVERGARVVICEVLAPFEVAPEVCYIVVESSERAMARVAQELYGDPSREITLVGVTGTNGKSTVATLLADLFDGLGYRAGLISTLTYRVGNREIPSTHTTPDTIRLNAMLREMVDAGCDYCFMEVSSHSLVQNRVAGLTFRGAIFTNLTHDHLDYHGSFMEYLRAKSQLFNALDKDAFAVTNIDDRNGEVMVQGCRANIIKVSTRSLADHRARIIEMHLDGMLLSVDGAEVWTRLVGGFNVHNILSIYATALQLGISREEVLLGISRLRSVRGRFEHISVAGGRTIIIDYAHTPDALESTLSTLCELVGSETREIITVCGCGGDRDREKRPEMARVAYKSSSLAIFTSDNPRREDPETILQEMIAGVVDLPRDGQRRWLKVTDRGEAIRTAVMMSSPQGVILIAGKGHEQYQIVGTNSYHFDDREEAIKAVEQYIS